MIAQVLPVSLFIPVLATLKLLNVDDLVPKELVNQAKNQAKYKPVASLAWKEKDSGNKWTKYILVRLYYLCLISCFPLVFNPVAGFYPVPICTNLEPIKLINTTVCAII